MNNPNSTNNNVEASTNEWTDFAAEMAEKEPEVRESERLGQELDKLNIALGVINKMYSGEMPEDVGNKLLAESRRLEEAIREARTKETEAILPDSQKEAFREYADNPSSLLTFEEVTDGIYRYSQGESLESIKEDILAANWNGDNQESNRARGESVYKKVVGFLGLEQE